MNAIFVNFADNGHYIQIVRGESSVLKLPVARPSHGDSSMMRVRVKSKSSFDVVSSIVVAAIEMRLGLGTGVTVVVRLESGTVGLLLRVNGFNTGVLPSKPCRDGYLIY